MEFVKFNPVIHETPSQELDDPVELLLFLETLDETEAIQFLTDYLNLIKG
jgi:hypothetical protein